MLYPYFQNAQPHFLDTKSGLLYSDANLAHVCKALNYYLARIIIPLKR